MRKIKFRGKKLAVNEWVYGSLVVTTTGKTYILQINGTTIEDYKQNWLINTPAFEVLPDSVYGFSGLKCKNNAEIYEGDILKYTKHAGYLMDDCLMTVCYDADAACFGYKSSISMFPDLVYPFCKHDELSKDVLDHCEIVGSIYENV
jgi:uncharacterized phage protein (TIGR01671 family)